MERGKRLSEYSRRELLDLLKEPEGEQFDRTTLGRDERENVENLGKEIAGLGTKNGGVIIAGQEDLGRGGAVTGIDERSFQKQFKTALANVHPPVFTEALTMQAKGRSIAVVRVQSAGKMRPCRFKREYYERRGDSTFLLEPDEVAEYYRRYAGSNAEDTPTTAKTMDIDGGELGRYERFLNKSKRAIVDSVSSEGTLTVRGAILLSEKPDEHVEGAFVEIQKYGNPIGAPPLPVGSPAKLSKPAMRMIEETVELVKQNLPVQRTYSGAVMNESPGVPEKIIRETIVNAIAHRNYLSHEHVLVRIFADGFDVSNPATISPSIWADVQALQARFHPNEGIYSFLNAPGLYEGRGEGLLKIREELEQLGKTPPEFKVIGETPSMFYARISLSGANARDAKMRKLEEHLRDRREITATQAMKLLNVSRMTAIKLLNTLVRQGLAEHTGSRRNSKYVGRGPATSEK